MKSKTKAVKTKSATKSKPKAVSIPTSERDTISIRAIDNGYILRHTSTDKNGGFMESETYTPNKPDLSIMKSAKS